MSITADGVAWRIDLHLPSAQAQNAAARSVRSAFIDTTPGRTDASGPSPAALAGKRFLVIEDEPLVALDMVGSLEQAGAEIVGSVGNASDAMALIEKFRPDAALLDGNLAGQPVADIASALTRENVPFAFVTGYGRESLPAAYRSADVLAKPFSQEQLLETAARLVRPSANVKKLRP
jgi:CheY-like chemotaxis protein